MRALFRSIRSSLLFLSLLAGTAMAKDLIVKDVSGRSFYVIAGRFMPITSGQRIPQNVEIYTEEGCQLTISDDQGRSYYLAGSGHMKIETERAVLGEGYLWVQSSADSNFVLESANSVATFTKADMVFSADSTTSKSQLLVVAGMVDFANINDRDFAEPIGEGHFSFIENDYEEGRPRKATAVGMETFKKVTTLFKGVRPMNKDVATAHVFNKEDKNGIRSPASQTDSTSFDAKKIYEESLKKEMKVEKKVVVPKKSHVPLKIFGTTAPSTKRTIASKEKEVIRTPASMSELTDRVKIDTSEGKGETFAERYKKEMRENGETSGLINELKSYGNEFHKSY